MVGGEAVKERMGLLVQEKNRRARLAQLRRDTTRKIDFVRRKAVIEHREVYQLIREFFKEFLDQRYEFTTNELRAELKKVYISNLVRSRIAALLDTLEAIEYATVHYARDDLLKILTEFEEVVVQLVRIHTGRKSVWERLRGFFLKEDEDAQSVIADLPALEIDDEVHVRILTLVERCYVALDRHRVHQAKAAYHHLLEAYATLDEERKKEHYPLIDQTYRDLVERMKM